MQRTIKDSSTRHVQLRSSLAKRKHIHMACCTLFSEPMPPHASAELELREALRIGKREHLIQNIALLVGEKQVPLW